ncbi:MAG: PDZ domain-containing protein [Gammaproteobacteria bacterium]
MQNTNIKIIFLIISTIFLLLPSIQTMAAGENLPWLGVMIKDLSFGELAAKQIDYGVEIVKIVDNSPADQSDLENGDIILEVDNKPVYSAERLHWLIQHSPVNKKVQISYFRNGKVKKTNVTLTIKEPIAVPRPFEELWRWPPSNTYIGAELQEMPNELRDYFGAPDDIGVLVVKLDENAPAQRAGLKVGDVIIKMDRKSIKNIDDIHRVLNFFDPGDKLTVEIIRDKQDQSIDIELAANPKYPYAPPKELLDPHYWNDELRELMEQLQDYWRKLPKHGFPPNYV